MARTKWDIERFKRELDEATEAGLDRGASVVQDQAQANLSRPGAPTSKTEAKNLSRAESILSSGAGRYSRLSRASGGVKDAARKALSLRRSGGLVDPPGGMPRRRTGRLRGSIVVDAPKARLRRIGPDASVPYAAIHEFGGVIVPKVAKYLKFVVGGRFVQTKRVVIPPRPYMRPSLDQAKSKVLEEFAKPVELVFPREVGT